MEHNITVLDRVFLNTWINSAEDIQVTANPAFLNNGLIENTCADLIIHECIEPVLQQTPDEVLTKTDIKQAKNDLTKTTMALMIPILALSITNHAQAEAVPKKSKTEKKAESSSGIKKQKSNEPDAPKELAVMTVTTADNRLDLLADTQSDPTYKSEFVKIEPVTLHTISQQDLDNVKFTDAYQVLNRVPGVSMTRNLRFQNGGRSYTANLMDGISVRAPLRGQVSDIENFDTDEIQRIEVTKGPASALFPSNAFGGVINVITKEPPEKPVRRV
ncbi:MAG: TonB-dependent receptor plug domain-containing protein [Methylobacter sp.]|nr:TonB-dependent receptor plug domain-containing protein [Methylobacter sp.]MDP2100811.1 TonB-dependent receptor plug domain-containing protein [Methylobacter sp.]MDP2427082.1 TonB-dependent receptor plug domain-containing protein [Methylobacter sp.]MDP3053060.1 TonB-dependent receptor plug domain-containing protein [Methylobacter sp.]MDP3363245.1 TonB-dependent receptor plug domain-containing protein [Methylobacter sp.]